ncbi:MAG: hypothetical protein KJ077_29005 [Anaerolineae bacterium]|nr:hypothetical protein [Anaerolineae bacterium]
MSFTIEKFVTCLTGRDSRIGQKKRRVRIKSKLAAQAVLTCLVLPLWLLTTVLLPLAPPAQATEPVWVFMSADTDGDGLPNGVETASWCNLKGCFITDPLDPDSDDDGLTDGEEHLFDSVPTGADGPRSPGLYVIYENSLKTKEYFPWQPYGHKFIARADSFIPTRPDVRDVQRGKTDLDAVVVRRGATFIVGGPLDESLKIEKSTGSLTTLTPVQNPFTGEWQVTVPSNGTVGKYTLKLGDESLDLLVVFELPGASGELTQGGVDRFVYDDDPNNLRDQMAIVLGDSRYPPSSGSPYQGQLSSTNYVNEGDSYAFGTEHYSRYMLEDYVIKAINGKTTQKAAADALTDRVDALTAFRNPRVLSNSWAVLHPGSNPRQQCSNVSGLLTSFNRAAGIAARPVMVDWKTSTFDHSTEIWLNNTWRVYRGYNTFEMSHEPDNSHLCGGSNWPRCGTVKNRSRSDWGGHSDYRGGAAMILAGDNWTERGLAYRSGSWNRGVIRLNETRLNTVFSIYWRNFGWSKEPRNLGNPGWPPAPSASLTANEVSTQADTLLQAQSAQMQLGQVINEYGLDTNGNGQYDQLVLEVEVTAAQAGRYWLRGQLSATQTDPSLMGTGGVLAEALVNPELVAGPQIVPLVFSGVEIGPKRVDGPYNLSGLWVTAVAEPGPSDFINESLAERTDLYLTQAYKAAEFETYGAVLSNQYSHAEVDSDGNGQVDGLAISTGLNIYRPGNYSVEGMLVDASGQFISFARWQGNGGPVELVFGGVAGRGGPYQLQELRALNEAGETVDEINEAYTIQPVEKLAVPEIASFDLALKTDELSPFGLTITPTQVFNTQVVNGHLQLNAQVNVGEAGSYKLEAWLADQNGNLVTWAQGQPTALDVGIQTLSAVFNGSNIQARGITGPYQVVALKILSGQPGYQVLDKVDVAMTTPAYALNNFQQPGMIFADFVQHGNTKWIVGAPWTITSGRYLYFSPSSAWSAADADGSLTLQAPLNLTKAKSVGLKFHTSYNFASGSAGYVEVSKDGGATWTTEATFTGIQDWSEQVQVVNLKSYTGAGKPPILIRFRLAAAGGGQWYIDDILVNGVPDRDGDGLSDGDEVQHGTNPDDPDSDNDGLPDGWEVFNNLNPLDPNGDNGGSGDPDNDRAPNSLEHAYDTDPHNPDTDGDGLPDGWEIGYQLDPLDNTGEHGASGDPDNDTLTNLVEYQRGTNPRSPDTDSDGIPDNIDPRVDLRSLFLPLIPK